MYHAQVVSFAPYPALIPALARLKRLGSVDRAFEMLNEHVFRHFELWCADGTCLNPVQKRRRTTLVMGHRGIIYIPPHSFGGEITSDDHIVMPDVVWMKKGEEVKLPAPHEHIVLRVIA